MAAPPTLPTPPKSRGHTLFDRQAQLHADTSDGPSTNTLTTLSDVPVPQMKPLQAFSSGPSTSSSTGVSFSRLLPHRRSPLSTTECYSRSTNPNVQLLGIHPRPESTYIKQFPTPPSPTADRPKTPEQEIQETDFPLIENVEPIAPTSSFCCDAVEKAFDYLPSDDDDNDVIHEIKSSDNIEIYDNAEHSEGNDSVDTIDLDATTSTNHQNDSKFYNYCQKQFDSFQIEISSVEMQSSRRFRLVVMLFISFFSSSSSSFFFYDYIN